ncbi:MAG TPA: GNAT family N-acetyltransferase, partial [Candidatus Binatia bacterium]|nr:GNAT family N-acetyltransferase [Candidatus Binatia bacterium]
MTRDELVELSDLNYAEAMRDLSRRAGGAVLDEDGLLLFTGGHSLPVLANAVMRTERRLDAPEVLARARKFFGARGRGFTVLVRAHADADLAAAAANAGLLALGEMPAMVLDHRLAEAVPPRGIDLRRVTTAEDVAAYGQVMGTAYATYGMPEDVLPAMLSRLETLHAPHIAAFVARVDGEPVAGAMTVVTHGVAGIYWVGTTPGARGRGLAELCTRAAGNAGFDLGGRIASLQA